MVEFFELTDMALMDIETGTLTYKCRTFRSFDEALVAALRGEIVKRYVFKRFFALYGMVAYQCFL